MGYFLIPWNHIRKLDMDNNLIATTRGVGLYYPQVLTTEQFETILKHHKVALLQPYQTHIALDTDYTSD